MVLDLLQTIDSNVILKLLQWFASCELETEIINSNHAGKWAEFITYETLKPIGGVKRYDLKFWMYQRGRWIREIVRT